MHHELCNYKDDLGYMTIAKIILVVVDYEVVIIRRAPWGRCLVPDMSVLPVMPVVTSE